MASLTRLSGLELVASLTRLRELLEYGQNKLFMGNVDFKRCMSRDQLLNFRRCLEIYLNDDHSLAVTDSLWHSRLLLDHFGKNSAIRAVPAGVSSLDENGIGGKGRTTGKSYMNSKPVRFGIRFYAVAAWNHANLHTMWDNVSGNKTR